MSEMSQGPRSYGAVRVVFDSCCSRSSRGASTSAARSTSFHHFDVDDALYVAQAGALLDGHWLGPYDHRRLAKGPGYALFLAGAVKAGLGRRLAEELLFALATLVLYRGLRRAGVARVAALPAVTIILLHPVMMTMVATRVVRDGFYSSLTLLLLGILLGLLRPASLFGRGLRALAAGLALAAFWVTRGEGAWIAPTLGLALGAAFLVDRAAGVRRAGALGRLVLAAALLALPTLAALAGWARMDEQSYGRVVGQELKAPAFNAAMGAINRVAATRGLRYEPLSAELRHRLYEVSPSFARLRGDLESPAFREPHMLAEDGERMAIFRSWVIRRSVERLGLAARPGDAEDFYEGLAREIDEACRRGDIDGGERRHTQFPAIGLAELERALSLAGERAHDLVALENRYFLVGPTVPVADVVPGERKDFERIEGRPFGSGAATTFARAAVMNRLQPRLRPALLVLAIAGAIGLLVGLVAAPFRGLSAPLLATLVLGSALAGRLALVAVCEAAWFRDVEVYLPCAYLLLPATAAAGLGAGLAALAGPLRNPVPTPLDLALGLALLGLAGWGIWRERPREVEIAHALPAPEGDLLFAIGARPDDPRRPRVLTGFVERPRLLLHRSNATCPTGAAVEFSADLGGLRYGIPFSAHLEGRNDRDEVHRDGRVWASRGPGLATWRHPIRMARLDRILVDIPDGRGRRFRVDGLSVVIDAGAARIPRPEDLRFRATAVGGAIHLELEGGEPDVTYHVYFGIGEPGPPREREGFAGATRIDPADVVCYEGGAPRVFDLVTDPKGRAGREIPWPLERPRPRVAQAQGRRVITPHTLVTGD
ncbi:MAG: hypothetical protein R3F20_17485 [Planctomycetota bacterium]